MMRAFVLLPALAGVLLFAGCRREKEPVPVEERPGEPSVVDLQKQLEEALKR